MNKYPGTEIKNAIIKSATLSTADHGMLSSFIHLEYAGSGQGFGGYALYSPDCSSAKANYAGHFIWRVLEIAGVFDWKDLPGKTIRAEADHGKVYRIGHIIKDKWFDPSEEFKKMEEDANS